MKKLIEIMHVTDAAKALGVAMQDAESMKNNLEKRGVYPASYSTYIDKSGNLCRRWFYLASDIRDKNAKAKADLMAEKARIEKELARYA